MFPLQLDYLVCPSSCPLRGCACQSLRCTLLQVMLCRYMMLCTEKSRAQEHRCTFTVLWKAEPESLLDNFYHFCDSLIWWVTVSPFFPIFIYYFLSGIFLHLYSSLKHKGRVAALSTICMWSPWLMYFTNVILLMGFVQVLLFLKDLSCWLPSVPWVLTQWVSIDSSVCEYRLNFHKCRTEGIFVNKGYQYENREIALIFLIQCFNTYTRQNYTVYTYYHNL